MCTFRDIVITRNYAQLKILTRVLTTYGVVQKTTYVTTPDQTGEQNRKTGPDWWNRTAQDRTRQKEQEGTEQDQTDGTGQNRNRTKQDGTGTTWGNRRMQIIGL